MNRHQAHSAPRKRPTDENREADAPERNSAAVVPMSQLPPFLTLEQVAAHVIPVTLNTLRWWVQTDKDGFDTECVVRRGRRVFVKKERLIRWMDD